jgi:serine-type D-Ala-D-Ala carboxypeptidase (penicillin-binding protein 5/6)
MRRGLLVLAVALGLAGAARAAPPHPDARAFIVVNATNGDVLASENARAALPIASITKLMTVVVALKHLKPDDQVTVGAGPTRVGGSHIPLEPGQTVSVEDLLEGALIQSANDAADALAAAASGYDVPRFVEWMNEEAQALGLRDTHFVRPDGLDAEGHYSSARDVAVLAQVAMHSPVVRAIVRRREATIEGGTVVLHTWNDLLGVFPGLIGVKTGHTSKAGWCEVAAARRQGYTIYAVILGSPTRAQRNADLDRLLSWGVSRYRTLPLVGRRPYARIALPYGRAALPLVATRPLVRVVPVGRPIVERVIAPAAIALPVRRGAVLGRIEVWSGGRLLGTRRLLAARSVPRPGLGGRLRWYATRTVHDLFGIFS